MSDSDDEAGGGGADFHSRGDTSLFDIGADDGDISSWDSCIKEGYLQKRGGKMGAKKHKQRFFRMRDYMILYYKKKKPVYGKPDGKIPQVRSRPARTGLLTPRASQSQQHAEPIPVVFAVDRAAGHQPRRPGVCKVQDRGRRCEHFHDRVLEQDLQAGGAERS